MHKLLKRQLKRYCQSDQVIDEKLLQAISDAYEQQEQELKILERSLYLTSNELNQRNHDLGVQLEQLQQTQTELQQSLATMDTTFNATGEVILVFDAQDKLINHNSMSVTFFNEHLNDVPQHWSSLRSAIVRSKQLDEIERDLKSNPTKLLSGTLQFINGQFYAYRTMPTKQQGKIAGRVWCLRDVSQQKEYEMTIQHQAYHDSLTGLPNRVLLIDRLQHAISVASRKQLSLAVLFIDLDNFKKVNDTEGHDAGDVILNMVSKRFKSRLRDQDTLARLGGDEFVILLEDIGSEEGLRKICTSILNILATPFEIHGRQYYISSSIGISVYPHDDKYAEALIRKADMSMYRAKEQGKNKLQFYSDKFEYDALRRVELEQELRLAIQNQELSCLFQPKVNLETMKIVSAEVLVRWIHADGSSTSPSEFIPIAEQTGLIFDISKYVLNKSCHQLRRWQQMQVDNIKLAVNFSSMEFHNKNVIDNVYKALKIHQISGSKLVIEVTESLFMEDKEQVLQIMNELKEIGVMFALDDFGKGYSSFSYLQTLPMDYLKIDKAFLQEVITNQQSSAIARTIIDVGRNLELEVIAEGIESTEVLDYVKSHGCSQAQGFYLHKPMTAEELTELLIQQQNL